MPTQPRERETRGGPHRAALLEAGLAEGQQANPLNEQDNYLTITGFAPN